MQGGRRRVLIGVLVVVDTLALLTVAILVLRGVEAGRTVVVPPTTTSSAGDPTASADGESLTFRLPSGNISCVLTADGATCTIGATSATTSPEPGCTGSVGHVVVLDGSGVTTPCLLQTPTLDTEAPVLDYGASRTVGGYTCASATTGVTCTRGDGAGFRLSRTALVVLP